MSCKGRVACFREVRWLRGYRARDGPPMSSQSLSELSEPSPRLPLALRAPRCCKVGGGGGGGGGGGWPFPSSLPYLSRELVLRCQSRESPLR